MRGDCLSPLSLDASIDEQPSLDRQGGPTHGGKQAEVVFVCVWGGGGGLVGSPRTYDPGS